MIRKVGLLTVLVGAAMFALAPSGSSAATTLGSTFDPDECEGDTTYIQTVSPGNSYSVPSDGVITHWTYQAHGTDGTSVKLKVGRVSPSADLTLNTDVTIVGESNLELVSAGSLGSFSTQIPVKAGDRIGEYVNGGFTGCSISDASFTDHYNNSDVGVGTTTLFSQENFQQDISAVWEPDCDNDGRGDDSQDSDTASCHPASTTGQRAAALQRCRKKAKKNHWTKKQRKKCRKKANKLPV
jgi:hypothetical protein